MVIPKRIPLSISGKAFLAGRGSGSQLVRSYSTPSAVETVTEVALPLDSEIVTAPRLPPSNVFAGIILSRVPIITPELSPFEKAYYHYQDELERRLMWTFPSYYYFKRGSLRERQFNTAQRGPVPRHANIWYPRGIPDIQHNRERRTKQEIVIPRQSTDNDGLFRATEESDDSLGRPIVANPRITEADKKNDIQSLSRKLDRTLYLVVKTTQNGVWKFPAFSLQPKESLHEAAERGLREIGGVNINTWTVSNTPAGVVRFSESDNGVISSSDEASASSLREFYIKSHILHGKFVPQNDEEYAWLTREELLDKLDKKYFEGVEPLLSLQ